jgi:hypothetical protein
MEVSAEIFDTLARLFGMRFGYGSTRELEHEENVVFLSNQFVVWTVSPNTSLFVPQERFNK